MPENKCNNFVWRFTAMRQISAITMGLVVLLLAPAMHAETAAEVASRTQAAIDSGSGPAWMSPKAPQDIQTNVQNKGKDLAKQLQLGDEAKEAKVAALLAEHYGRVWAWHQQADEKLDAAWSAWNDARDPAKGGKDELKAMTVMVEQVDPIYAEFAPQIQGLLRALRKELSEAQVIALLDRITRSPGVERTYQAYVAMVPEMKEDEKKIIRSRLEQARVDSLAAWKGGEIVKIFKKYKLRNESSIDNFGYGYRKHYEDWINKSKAAKPGETAEKASSPASEKK
jgi:hypothetical protein